MRSPSSLHAAVRQVVAASLVAIECPKFPEEEVAEVVCVVCALLFFSSVGLVAPSREQAECSVAIRVRRGAELDTSAAGRLLFEAGPLAMPGV